MKIQQCRQSYTSLRLQAPPFARESCKRPTSISIDSARCSTAGLRQPHTLSAAIQPARSLMQSQNVSFLSVFHGFTIRFHFFSGDSGCAEPQARSERIVFVRFLWVYDTFSLFQRRFSPRGAPCKVRTYRFCPFFMGLRYVFTFSVVFLPARSLMQSQNVSFLPVFHGFTIRFHFSSSDSARD